MAAKCEAPVYHAVQCVVRGILDCRSVCYNSESSVKLHLLLLGFFYLTYNCKVTHQGTIETYKYIQYTIYNYT